MADALLDKSLDALIAERSSKRPPGSGDGRSKPSNRGGNRAKAKAAAQQGGKPAAGGGRPQGGQAAGTAPRVITALRVQGSKVAKPAVARGRGGRNGRRAPVYAVEGAAAAPIIMAGPPGYVQIPASMLPAHAGQPVLVPMPVQRSDTKPYTRRDPDADGKWVHDLAPEPARNPRRNFTSVTQRARPAVPVGHKLRVSNLAEAVTQEDIKELFGDKGEVLKAELGYDRSGRLDGTATVTYKDKSSALAAIDAFNGVLLDGLELKIELVKEQVVMQLASGLQLSQVGDAPSRPPRGVSGAGRLLGTALSSAGPSQGMGLPRGMGDPAPAPRRGPGPGPRSTVRVRSGVTQRSADDDDMQE